jgi:anti-sigma-K factor RskA
MSFLRVSTSGAFAGEYWMGVLELTDKYSAANIARHEQDCFAICEWHRLFIKFY